MRGVTLLEFLVGMSLFLVLMFFGYHAFDLGRKLHRNIASRTRPEIESNYRLLLMKQLLERSSERLRVHPFLEGAPVFFPDLSFGTKPQANSFSVARVTGLPILLMRSGSNYKMQAGAVLQEEKIFLLAGSDGAGNYCWNYARTEQISKVGEDTFARFHFYTTNPQVEKGVCTEVEIYGFLFQNQTLYAVSSGGALQPFLSPLDSFEYNRNNDTLTIRWQSGAIGVEFRCVL
jgi:hypothetical protein